MAQQVKELATNPDNLSEFNPRKHYGGRSEWTLHVI